MRDKNVSSVGAFFCMGCGACAASCPKSCIEMRYDNEGFLQPHVNQQRCVSCGRCLETCPARAHHEFHEPIAYKVLQLSSPEELHRSASGGAAYGLGVSVIENGGSVVGCVMGKGMLPTHVVADNIQTLKAMQGSKYVQSIVGVDTYAEIKNLLATGQEVLFTGTPCQVAGLYGYLGKKPENLFTLDLVCHGVASPGVFWHYIKRRGEELGGRVVNVRFRCKDLAAYPDNHSLHLDIESSLPNTDIAQPLADNRATIIENCSLAIDDPFGAAFYHNRILRESCYRCPFACRERVADVTLGDYGEGVIEQFPSSDGYSFVSINTERGIRMIEKTSACFYRKPIDMSYRQVNLRQPTLRPKARAKMHSVNAVPGECSSGIEGVLGVTFADRIKRALPDSLKFAVKMALGRIRGH